MAAMFLLAGCAPAERTASAPTDHPSTNLAGYPAERIAENLESREIRPGFFVVTHAFPWPHNSLLVEMVNSDLLLVDTPYTPGATRELLAWAEARFGKRNRTAINTHFHFDNLGGNPALLEAGIPVYGSGAIPGQIAERGATLRAQMTDWLADPRYAQYREGYGEMLLLPPDHLFPLPEGRTLEFGGESVQIFFPGAAHSPDNVVVYFPARRILFGGCMILAGEAVGNTADADLAAWPDSVKSLERFGFDLLIPGHGDRMDPALLAHTRELLAGT